jgi:hypothetical protein
MKTRRIIKICLGLLCFPIVGLAIFGVLQIRDFSRSTNFDPKSEVGFRNCLDAYEKMVPAITTVEIFYQWKGRLPESETEIRSIYGSKSVPVHLPFYMKDEKGYLIYMKLGWDSSLKYKKVGFADESLIYDPGDGGAEIVIENILNRK